MSLKTDHFNLLKSIPRKKHRNIIKLNNSHLPFFGKDVWTLYELSWLNENGIPEVAVAILEIHASSLNIIESKSLKMYINSFHQTKFSHSKKIMQVLKSDLTNCICGQVSIKLFTLDDINNQNISKFQGVCIDKQNINIKSYQYDPSLLICHSKNTLTESLYSHLFKSNCPITHQPDWASIQIIYSGKQINHSALLAYLISFRGHNEFHEECVERIFHDILSICKPNELTIYARYTRRGGIDINPWRTNSIFLPSIIRMARQ
ncbi:NADPH-dependent 7-cyano-7-deazaguanine reductase [Buchnera aphidicola (Diuraphis noxia)]|uniref:NADPH-dependent 7-cyano-7-deazaguanine reductase n=1 Tax=Buchnera aphidicola subsp. Diuraphis noxia TaxID=118101 RepID=A0A1B2H8F5_BUCDN|nr:NADPH-dependent 7-cyano-7-deazaguanine reductase QueF [Buchnera aphidicola]ANZ22511.1 NADPH-dependent 7-cyano-7-deazaguanine reductase [Buchnera aphidicola (Diuraphis noxia)]